MKNHKRIILFEHNLEVYYVQVAVGLSQCNTIGCIQFSSKMTLECDHGYELVDSCLACGLCFS